MSVALYVLLKFMPVIFLDNNATTQPLESVQAAMLFAMNQGFGNASSAHRGGEAARRIIAASKSNIAKLVGTSTEQVVFTSGATEANNWVFQSILDSPEINRIVTTDVEHSSISELVRNNPQANDLTVQLSVSREGLIDLNELARHLSRGRTFVSIHWVNNETGVVQDIDSIGSICREHGAILHVDGSQAVGKLPIEFANSRIDFLTFAAHKFHGPQGVGALCFRDRSLVGRFIFGGGQEMGLRPGTENLPGIAGFGKAAEMRLGNFEASIGKMLHLRNEFERLVLTANHGVCVNGDANRRVCNTSNLRFEGVDGQALVAQLDAMDIRCSQSSACTAQIPEPSYVLRAMGLSEAEAYSSVRFSFSILNTIEEIQKTVEVVTKRVTALREFEAKLFTESATEMSEQ